ncbi:polyprenyl synthetase family protein [Streptomyces sp. ISL-44]|uniref:polyprenyl synthetase family protein n=1 Tax=Streptomyces sp. ISL-44 TaxID=2819184 RepID=UPI0027E21FB7|nr:polyprenyl synthetase family protein [Streptomyces sp. ISL-44]
MNSLSYLDLHRELSQDIDAEIAAALERLDPASATARTAVAELLEQRKLKYPISVLPLLVHGAETGFPEPAVPISAVHLLWWTSACHLDDLADGNGSAASDGLTENETLLASVIAGNILPVQIILSQQVPESVHGELLTEIVNGSIAAADGQMVDMRGDAAGATRGSVIETYRGKSGAPYGMITAMAAILSGTKCERVELWREFGYVFGIIWQLFNDQEDILSGRNEDLANGTVTYLLACAVEDAAPESRGRILDLCAAAGRSRQARGELASLLRAPALLDRYRADIDGYRDEARRLLDELGGDEVYLPVLRQLVDHSARMLLEPDLAPDNARDGAPDATTGAS